MSGTLYQYVESTGVIVPDTSTILAEVQAEFTGVFGAGMNLDSSTPQGLLIAGEVLARANVIQNNAAVANQFNPNQSLGLFIDAICALTGLERSANTYTKVSGVVLAGVPGSPIAAGSVAATASQAEFSLDAAVTLAAVTGQAVGSFTALVPGPVACGVGALGLTAIVSDVLGWETVSCPVAGTLGGSTQSDEGLRALRRNTLALQGVSLIGAISSAVAAIPGVLGLQILENYTAAPVTIGGITLARNSIYLCVDGGNQADIATALLSNKSTGCNWNGGTTVNVIEPISNQTYAVKYDTPVIVPLLAQITVKQGTFTGDPTAGVKQAVVDFSNNAIVGLTGFSVGESASPFEIAAAIMEECPGLYVRVVALSLTGAVNYQPTEIVININQKAQITTGNVSVLLVA